MLETSRRRQCGLVAQWFGFEGNCGRKVEVFSSATFWNQRSENVVRTHVNESQVSVMYLNLI